MPEVKHPIILSCLLTQSARSREKIQSAIELATRLGMTYRSVGKTSISFAMEPDQFQKLFDVKPRPKAAKRAGTGDFGSPPGYVVDKELRIPVDLTDLIESISVEPPAIRMDKQPRSNS